MQYYNSAMDVSACLMNSDVDAASVGKSVLAEAGCVVVS